MLLTFLCIVVAALCLFSSSVPTINDGLIFNDAAAQVVTTIAQESTSAADLAVAQEEADRVTSETAAAWRRVHLAECRRDRYHKKKIAKTAACPSGPTESSLSSSSSGTLTVL